MGWYQRRVHGTPAGNNGDSSKGETYILRRQEVQEAHRAQGYPVQDWQGLPVRPGQASLRSQTAGLRRTDQACVPQEGKDHQEDCVASRVLRVRVQVSRCSGPRQALRACRCRQWKAQEEELDIAQKCRYLALDVLGLLLSFICHSINLLQ